MAAAAGFQGRCPWLRCKSAFGATDMGTGRIADWRLLIADSSLKAHRQRSPRQRISPRWGFSSRLELARGDSRRGAGRFCAEPVVVVLVLLLVLVPLLASYSRASAAKGCANFAVEHEHEHELNPVGGPRYDPACRGPKGWSLAPPGPDRYHFWTRQRVQAMWVM